MDPGPGRVTRTDFAIDVAHAMGRARLAGGRIRLSATLSLEGATIPGGVLTPGAVGEGYIDSRHPHTYLHELVATAQQPLGRSAALSITAGKGFVPFGTDDPMSRPALRYPVDHHWAQVLERFVAIVGVRAGPAAVGPGLFRPSEFYGDDTIWFVTAGVRVGVGRPHRMGRYGVVEAEREGPVRHGGH